MPLEFGSFSLGAVTGGVVVGFLNHYLAKSRDEENRFAKDFNEVADALSVILTNEKDCPSTNSDIDFKAFRRVLSDKELQRFDMCVKEYESAIENSIVTAYDNSNSGIIRHGEYYKDTSAIITAIDNLLTLTKRK